MKIAYGIMGEGRGHASRLLTIGPKLDAELLIFAGGDAYRFLSGMDLSLFGDKVELVKIPCFAFKYRGSKISFIGTAVSNWPKVLDIKLHKWPLLKAGIIAKKTKFVEDKINDFNPSLIISDGEPYISHVKRKVPLISFDRFAKIAFCESSVPMTRNHKRKRWITTSTYHQLLAKPDYIIASSFYDAKPKEKMATKISSFGPVLRQEVLGKTSVDGDHVVVYATNPYIYTYAFFQTLQNIERQVFCYGSGRNGKSENVTFCELQPTQFVKHISSCAYVISTPGNMLLSELRYFGKRVLLIKTDSLEQRENILYAAKLEFGSQIAFEKVFSHEELERQVDKLKPADDVSDNSDKVVEKIKSFA